MVTKKQNFIKVKNKKTSDLIHKIRKNFIYKKNSFFVWVIKENKKRILTNY